MKNGINALVREHKQHNVYITGEKGSGKDIMTGNIVARISERYVSNLDYTHDERFIPLDLSKFDCGLNTYEDFINGVLHQYVYPYEDNVNVYISDAQNYFPSYADSLLSKKYPYLNTWASLQRQLGDSSLHMNTQAYMRVWKTLRDQCSDNFIRCERCFVLFGDQGKFFAPLWNKLFPRHQWNFKGIVFATYYFYDKASSCENRVKPCRIKYPLFANRDQRLQVDMYKDKFYNTYGTVQKCFYVCVNKSCHDTRAYKKILENGGKLYEKTDC